MSTPTFRSPFHSIHATLPDVIVTGAHAYGDIVARYHDEPPLLIAARLMQAFPDDFIKVENALSREAWLFLATVSPASVFPLVNPSFSARLHLLVLAEGTHTSPDFFDALREAECVPLLAATSGIIRQLDEDVGKAAWVILAIQHCLRHSEGFELEDEPWWEYSWLSGALPVLPSWRAIPRVTALPDSTDDVTF